MASVQRHLPQLDGELFLTDAGIETTLIFHDGLDLPHFAAFHLLREPSGRAALRRYYTVHAEIARRAGLGFILESPTWRASSDWGAKLGYSDDALALVNETAIGMMRELRDALACPTTPMIVSGCVGPRGDGYDAGQARPAAEFAAYHAPQIDAFARAGADLVTAITMTNVDEAIGVTGAAHAAGLPVVISFTVETDGRLPAGQALGDAIAMVDAAAEQAPLYYMINCAHPTHFADALGDAASALRIRGIRANASRRSHQELNDAPDLDIGNPIELGADYAALRRAYPHINVLGGCCGTDHRHIEAIANACCAA